MNPAPASLSVILISAGPIAHIEKTVQHLAAQTRCSEIELVIGMPAIPANLGDRAIWASFQSVQLVPVGEIKHVASAKIQALAHAHADVIALTEDHVYPAANWADTLLNAHAGPVAAVGVQMRNGNPESAVSWADFILSFGEFIAPAPGGKVSSLPGHNISYKRSVLDSHRADLEMLLTSEAAFCVELTRSGQALVLETRSYIDHLNVSHWQSFVKHTWLGGRIYGAVRARDGGWSVAKRLAYAAGSPLIPLVRFPRLWRDLVRIGMQRRFWSGIGLALCVGLVLHSLGEGVGYVFGDGDAIKQYAELELGRGGVLV